MLEIRDLSKSYRKRSALRHVDLKFDHGIYAILGPNGSGKSTLMNLICDQLRADEGEILWKGRPIQLASRTAVKSTSPAIAATT